MAQPSFAHLRAHSHYSLGQGLLSPTRLVATAVARGMTSVGLADTGTIAGIPEFVAAAAEAGITPIPGIRTQVSIGRGHGIQGAPIAGEAVFVALDRDGLRGLARIHNLAEDHEGEIPVIALGNAGLRGVLMLTGGCRGIAVEAMHAGEVVLAETLLLLGDIFPGNLAIELQRDEVAPDDQRMEKRLVAAAREARLPLAATHQPFFAEKDDHRSHVLLTQIARRIGGPRDVSAAQPERWFVPADHMRDLFADLPEACDATLDIAGRVRIGPEDLAAFRPVPVDASGLRVRAEKGLAALMDSRPGLDRAAYEVRLGRELDAAEAAGQASRFAAIGEVAERARRMRALVGPGRGSLAGCLLGRVLGATSVDPVQAGLTPDRHLSLGRKAVFDIEVEARRRDELEERSAGTSIASTARVSTYQSLGNLGLIMTVAATMGQGSEEELRERFPEETTREVRRLLRHGDKGQISARVEEIVALLGEPMRVAVEASAALEGHDFLLLRHLRMNEIVASGGRIADALPLLSRSPSTTVFDREALGLIGADTVALLGSTRLESAAGLCRAAVVPQRRDPVDFDLIPEDDEAVWDLVGTGPGGLFALGGDAARATMRAARPRSVGELAVLVAMLRPGMDLRDYLERLDGTRRPKPPHPVLADALAGTAGMLVFAEQVTTALQALCGIDAAEADGLARRIAHGRPEEDRQAAQGEIMDLAVSLGSAGNARDAQAVFFAVMRFGRLLMFRSHAYAQATMAYREAWLRVHRGDAWVAAKLREMVGDVRCLGQVSRSPAALALLREAGLA